MKKYVENSTSNLYIAAANELGYKVTIIDSEHSYIKIKLDEKIIYVLENRTDRNDALVSKVSHDKYLISKLLSKSIQIIPESKVFYFKDITEKEKQFNIKSIIKLAKERNYNIVIKPVDSSLGRGVTVKPKSDNEVKYSIKYALEHSQRKKLHIQEFINGDEYRLILINGEIIDILKKTPAHIVGNGKNTINELIENKNKLRKQMGLSPIVADHGSKITLKETANVSQGGETIRVRLNSLHPDYINIFREAYKLSRASFLGIDLITDNIQKKPTQTNSGIIELNGSPQITGIYYADLLENRPLYGVKKILRTLINI